MIGNLVAHPSQSTRPPIVLGKSVQASFQSRESAKGLQMFQTLELEHITSCRHAFIWSKMASVEERGDIRSIKSRYAVAETYTVTLLSES